MLRTHNCGELRPANAGQTVTLAGWVHRRRSHGGLIFIDMRDRWGLTQVVFNPEVSPEAHEIAVQTRPEYVIQVTGIIEQRPAGTVNASLSTGEIELMVQTANILNPAKNPPFYINEDVDIDESLRLQHRYLDLRRTRPLNNLRIRHELVRRIREWMWDRDFIDVETPILVKETPGGAREFLVPSRLHPGHFYALPQSPQQYKQMLMVGGIDRYFQIARCFRDEDLRADRVLEFTQLDVEMSFIEQEDILNLTEALLTEVCPPIGNKQLLASPFPRMTYEEAMSRFGSDKPDIRFGLELCDVTSAVKRGAFRVFDRALDAGGVIKALVVPDAAGSTRRELDELNTVARRAGVGGLVTCALTPNGIKSPLARFFSEDDLNRLFSAAGCKAGDLLLLVADQKYAACEALGAVRLAVGDKHEMADPNVLAFCWITEIPAFEWSAERGTIQAKHHQFTSILPEDIPLLDTDPIKARANQYDVVLNGYELGGGSIRIHERELQSKIFRILGMSDERTRYLFGHMLDAFEYGTPPHGGIAVGIDRLSMILAGEDNLREMTAFPKSQAGVEPMTGSPDVVSDSELEPLHIKVTEIEPD